MISKQLQGEIPKKISSPKGQNFLLRPPPRRNDPRATDLITCCPLATSLSFVNCALSPSQCYFAIYLLLLPAMRNRPLRDISLTTIMNLILFIFFLKGKMKQQNVCASFLWPCFVFFSKEKYVSLNCVPRIVFW